MDPERSRSTFLSVRWLDTHLSIGNSTCTSPPDLGAALQPNRSRMCSPLLLERRTASSQLTLSSETRPFSTIPVMAHPCTSSLLEDFHFSARLGVYRLLREIDVLFLHCSEAQLVRHIRGQHFPESSSLLLNDHGNCHFVSELVLLFVISVISGAGPMRPRLDPSHVGG